ncbi:hypothetical protein [Nocardiopsis sp. CC223A]|uniref:hypothetical protein n=1 Tax=Nocardiopsis sp. CC223A TaxID=3044051 RepID=UPI00278BC59E|nr:hypothetical protein [Nocardiopsis sp. CC223A]
MKYTLTHEGRVFLDFRHYGFPNPHSHAVRWVNVEHLRFSGTPTDRELLAALIGHERFRDTYAGYGVRPEETRHGSYRSAAITPESYEPVERQEGEAVLRTWAEQYSAVSADLAADLRREVFDVLDAAARIFHLTGFGEEDFHDWGGIHGEFHEFVSIDRAQGRIALLVAGDD